MRDRIVIQHCTWARKGGWTWTFMNKEGGSFSNSGTHSSFKKCLSHCDKMGYKEYPVFIHHIDWDWEKDAIGNETVEQYR